VLRRRCASGAINTIGSCKALDGGGGGGGGDEKPLEAFVETATVAAAAAAAADLHAPRRPSSEASGRGPRSESDTTFIRVVGRESVPDPGTQGERRPAATPMPGMPPVAVDVRFDVVIPAGPPRYPLHSYSST